MSPSTVCSRQWYRHNLEEHNNLYSVTKFNCGNGMNLAFNKSHCFPFPLMQSSLAIGNVQGSANQWTWHYGSILNLCSQEQWEQIKRSTKQPFIPYTATRETRKGGEEKEKTCLVNESLMLFGLFGDLDSLFGEDLLRLIGLFRYDLLRLCHPLHKRKETHLK